MARYSTPATRAHARHKAEAIGAAERVIYGELRDLGMRVVNHWITPTVAVVAFVAFIILGHGLVDSINL